MRAAASSRASGRPSRRRTIAATARPVRRREREGRLDLLGTLHEQRDRGRLQQFVDAGCTLRRHIQRRQRQLCLRPDLQRRAARGDDLQRGASGHERCDVAGGLEHLLQVVEQEKHASIADDRADRVECRAAVRLGDVERDADRGHHVGCRRDGCDRDECRSIRKRVLHAAKELDREPRLSGAAGSGDGQDAGTAAQPVQRRLKHLLAAEQRRGWRWRRLEDRSPPAATRWRPSDA